MGLRDLTLKYIENFNKKNIDVIGDMIDDNDAYLSDPNTMFIGKKSILNEISNLFSFDDLKFYGENVYVLENSNTSIIEFKIEINGSKLSGVDIIEWKNNKIAGLRAYVNEDKERNIVNV